ncbi:DRTGG domain-containing protein [Clostridium sp. HMP27]|uniref:DRTGG domain-containing protein n=1 Tax=Clostridium sp. HMP27 TaxID=1487921 RepID=UPI00052BD0BC|nr:DRTGG domain-containing protein [Clostridium sp. HMP27]KGK87329.1 hypothetical protein DP68_11130 [Clostridium sp. HMP27]
MSKHNKVINYITSLQVGTKISVRTMASNLNISEGTAYKGIKECEALGLVTTIPRIGTVRIEKLERKSEHMLTFGEVVNIINGNLVAGKDGIHKTLNQFVIGAMTPEAISEYIYEGCIIIAGNREIVHRLALEKGCGVIITGGFKCSEDIKDLANEFKLPVILTPYDTFTIATMINKAMSETMVKKDIVLVKDVMDIQYPFLKTEDKITRLKELTLEASEALFPVVNDDMKLVGVVGLRNLSSKIGDDEKIERIMDKNFLFLEIGDTAAYAAHLMESQAMEFCPVNYNKKLVGVLKRENIIRALKRVSNQLQVGENLESIILKKFNCEKREDKVCFSGKIVPEMLDPIGTASWGALNMLLTTVGMLAIKERDTINLIVDNVSTYFVKPLQMDEKVDIYAEIMDYGRNSCKIVGRSFYKVEVEMNNGKGDLIAKCMMLAKAIRS